MKISGINSQNIINTYNKNSENRINVNSASSKKDTIEISSIGKSLRNYSLENTNLDKSNDLEIIKNEVKNGTYNVDAKLTAQSILDYIRGKKV
ncbi:MAG: hypothetical protein GX275_13490 [Clostridiales bacterium]|nr:hypothetical protein [Clostridiales bacterium]